ncbi:hypothetical protein SteCoe_10114 [Stentor coeruleus]|uniref:Uncharacterized protein n=1 Tax=Stentor coeruleus TaxID=5963 RepID=A0A1R2CGB7_9CILI|nr:hypothetical protein SteCoe_10114 [Stentor coeruleus]
MLILLISLSSVLSTNFESIVLFQDEAFSLNLYNHFTEDSFFIPDYLTFTSNSSTIQLPHPLDLAFLYGYNYSNPISNNSLPYITYAAWSNNSTTFLIDFSNNTLYFFQMSLTNPISYIMNYTLDYAIRQISIYNPTDIEAYCIVLTWSDKNIVFVLNLNYFTEEIHDFDVIELVLWDLYYVENLKTCSVNNTFFIPFIGSISENGVVFIYNFANVYNPVLFQYANNYYEILDSEFTPIDIAVINTIDILKPVFAILDLSNTIIFLINNESGFQISHSIFLDEYGTVNCIKAVGSEFINNVYKNLGVIVAGTQNGIVFIDYDLASQMYYVLSSTYQNLSIVPALQTVVIYDTFFTLLETGQLMITYDNIYSKVKIYCINTEIAEENITFTKWGVFQSFNSYIFIFSETSSIQAYTISFDLPIAYFQNSKNETISIIASNPIQQYKELIVKLDIINNFNDILYCSDYNYVEDHNSTKRIIFEGFQASIDINVYEYISGRNSSFIVDIENNNLFSLSDYNVKVKESGFPDLKKFYTKIVSSKWYNVAVDDEGADYYDNSFNNLYKRVSLPNILEVMIFEGITYFSYYDGSSFIYLHNIFKTQKLKTIGNCTHLLMANNFLVCGGFTFINIFYCEILECYLAYNETFNNSTIMISMALSYNPLGIYPPILYLLTDKNEILLNFIPIVLLYGVNSNYTITHIEPNCFFIRASANQFYTITPFDIFVYTPLLSYVRKIPFNSGINSAHILNDFLYVINQTGYLTMIDGKQPVINSYYYEKNIDDNCTLNSVWFDRKAAYYGLLCSKDGANQIYKIYITRCPMEGLMTACDYFITFSVRVLLPLQATEGIYYQTVTISAENQFNTLPITIVFEYIIFGQAALLGPNSKLTQYTYPYDFSHSYNLHEVFTGNNLGYSIKFNNRISNTAECCDPIIINQNIEELTIFDYRESVLSITAIPNTNFTLASTKSGFVVLMEIDKFNKTVNIKKYFSLINIITSGVQCISIQTVSVINNTVLIMAACKTKIFYSIYWEGVNNKELTITKGMVSALTLDLSNLEMIMKWNYFIFAIPKVLKIITGSMYTFTVILISEVYFYIDVYMNNFLLRVDMTWNGVTITKIQYEHISMLSLNLTSFTAMSVDGFYNKNLHVIVADYWQGLLILKIVDNISRVLHMIPGIPGDPFVSVGTVHKGFHVVTKSGLLKTFIFSGNMFPVFLENRYPFTTSEYKISSIASFVIPNDYYNSRYLIYPVMYDEINMYYRVVDTMMEFSSYVMKDLIVENNLVSTDYNMYYATFISPYCFCFIVNSTKVIFYSLNDFLLVKPSLTISGYKLMRKKWDSNNFKINLVAENKNSQADITFYLNITGPHSENNYNDGKVQPWVLVVIAVTTLIVLMVSVKIVHKFVFSRRRRRLVRMDSGYIAGEEISLEGNR